MRRALITLDCQSVANNSVEHPFLIHHEDRSAEWPLNPT